LKVKIFVVDLVSIKNNNDMYVILKKTRNIKHTFLVNDDEGIPMEFEKKDEADRFAEIFRRNSVNGSEYTVKKLG
tara:strand:- start:6010 stop:6234 length:225 start_codon:yes stop_codon:yes gene_type:complete